METPRSSGRRLLTRHFGRADADQRPGPTREPRSAWTGASARRTALRDIGFAEAYIDGGWTTPHLADLLRLMLANRRRWNR